MPIEESAANMINAGRKHPVPQNVMDVEFKVVGDLTVRQVMYLFAGGMLVFIFFKSGLPFIWRWFFMIATGILAIAVAFIPIQERGLDKWLVSFLSAIKNPTQRVWRKSYNPPEYFLSDYAQIIKNEIITLTPAKSRSKLDEYLGTQTSEIDYDENELKSLENIRSLYTSTTPVTEKLKGEVKLPTLAEIHKDEMTSKVSMVSGESVNRALHTVPKSQDKDIEINVKSKMPDTIILSDINDMKKQEDVLKKQITDLLKTTKKAKRQFETVGVSKKHKQNKLAFFNTKYSELEEEKKKLEGRIQAKQAEFDKSEFQSSDIKEQIQMLQKENQILEQQLLQLQNEIMKLTNIKAKQTGEKHQQPQIESHNIPKKKKATIKIPHLSIFNTKENKQGDPSKYSLIQEKPKTLADTEMPKEKLEKIEIAQTQQIVNKKHEEEIAKALEKEKTSNIVDIKQVKPTKNKHTPSVTKSDTHEKNIIHGVVKNPSGKLIENAVILIKNDKGDIVRALKSNKLGHFKTQTELEPGKYTIEAVKGKLKFDIIAVTVNNSVLPSVTLIAKE